MKRLIYIATNNQHKVEEIGAALRDLPIKLAPAKEVAPGLDWLEVGQTFAENARIKALAIRQKTEAAVLADDSGLVVDALNGAPGIYSSRYAGANATDSANVDKLLLALFEVPEERRTARFVCSLCFITEIGQVFEVEAICPGRILTARHGGGGFGYDPVFALDNGKTMAEISRDEKSAISHRGKALEQLKNILAKAPR